MNFRHYCISLLFIVVFHPLLAQNKDKPNKGFVSWLPASKWEDALLTGNGTMGAMVMGNPFRETIILNHALLYLPNEKPLVPPDMARHRDEINRLSLDGKFKEVAELGVQIWEDEGYGDKKWTDPYVPAANLTIDMPASNVENYRRIVNFETAEAIVKWTDQKGTYTRKAFVSRADGVIVTHISGTATVTASISLIKPPHSWEQNALLNQMIKRSETTVQDGFMNLHVEYGKPHSHSPEGYNGVLKLLNKGGKLEKVGNKYKIDGADEVLIITKIEPYKGNKNESVTDLKKHILSVSSDYSELLNNQIKTHGELYNRVSLILNASDNEMAMTSETLVDNVRNEPTAGLMQRQFEAARYNILCSTGTNPPNLQGIWSGTWTPPWSSDFTHDGNIQVAISNLLNGNMPELMMSYFDYHERMMDDYRTNAKKLYGARGIHVPSHTSTHGLNNHYDETWCLEYWNGGAGWAASYFFDYYLYTGDKEFLKERAFPFMNEALMFWEDFLTIGEDGKYLVVPSYSPENNPLEHRWQNSINATMDIMIIKELTHNWITAAKIIGISKDEIKKKKAFLTKLPEYQISDDGVLREWLWDGLTDNQSHRHASHLYGVYEVPDKEILASAELQKAVKKTINERMKIRKQHQGGEMAFGMCHLGFAAVNMNDKATATEILEYLSRFYWTNSMATTHNPGNLFNMDISGGIPSLLTRMIVNSSPGYITLFPAKPDKWVQGELKGILVRGNIIINEVKWDEKSTKLKITSKDKQKIILDLNSLNFKNVNVVGAKYQHSKNVVSLNLESGKAIDIVIN